MELQVNGATAFAATGGKPFKVDQPAMIMVHGSGMDHTVWSMQARYFAYRGFSVLSVDLPGHGRSGGEALPTIEAMGAWILALIEASGASDVALVGHSMGALVVMEAASGGSEKIKALSLLGASQSIPVNPALIEAAQGGKHLVVENMVEWGVGRPAQIGGHHSPGAWVTGSSLRLLEQGDIQVLAADLIACNKYERGLEAAAGVTCPTLVVMGEDDRMTPVKKAAPMVEALSNSQSILLRRAGHMMLIEQPNETLDALADFHAGLLK